MKIRLAVTFGVLLLLGSCVSRQGSVPPAWINESSGRADRGERIIAYGSGVNTAEAETVVYRDLESQVTRVLIEGTRARGIVIDERLAAAIEHVAAIRAGELQGDRFSRSGSDDQEEFFLLVLYTTEMIESDLDLIEATSMSPLEPERGANELLWTDLVVAVTDLPPESFERRLDRLNEARAITDSIDISMISSISSMPLGEVRSPRLSVGVTFSSPSVDTRYVRTEMRFVEVTPVYDGERIEREELFMIEEGTVSTITPPPPDLTGVWQYRVEPIWLQAAIDRWTVAIAEEPERRRSALTALLGEIEERLQVRTSIQVTSSAIDIPTAVIILDRDIAGNPIAGDTAARNAVRRFDDLGFRARLVELDDETRRRLSDHGDLDVERLYDILPFDVLSVVDRAAIGWADIIAFDEGESFNVEVGLEVEVFDLRRDRVLTGVTFEERTAGGDAQTAIRAAFASAGRRAADLLAVRLP